MPAVVLFARTLSGMARSFAAKSVEVRCKRVTFYADSSNNHLRADILGWQGNETMKRIAVFSMVLLAGLCAKGIRGAAGNKVPVLLELFTSEGCSDCPSADKLLETLDRSQPIEGAELIVLSEHVDYFNSAGWSDPWSSAANTARQANYEKQFRLGSSYTPQLVVDGQIELVGSDAVTAREAIRKAIRRPKLPVSVSVQERKRDRLALHLEVPALPEESSGITVFVALADNQDQSRVTGGENGGRTLSHVAVVRALGAVGTASRSEAFSKDVKLPLKAGMGMSGLRVVAFLQDKNSGRILGRLSRKSQPLFRAYRFYLSGSG